MHLFLDSPNRSNLKLIVAYLGTDFLGWQKTKMGPSIEETLEQILTTLLRHPVQLQAASRTDAGVHAKHQVVNIFTPHFPNLFRLQKGIRSLLPKTISLLDLQVVSNDFHATLDTCGKEYLYTICNSPIQLPCHVNTSWHIKHPINVEQMKQAAEALIGTHDFAAFTSEPRENNIRTIHSIEIRKLKDQITIAIQGNHFLYKMARTIAGTLIYVGMDKISTDAITTILKKGSRSQAGVTAPAHGLCLSRVFYTHLR